MTTGSAQHLPWTLVASIPSATSDSFSTGRRILYRALAVVVALAAIAPLFFGADLNGSASFGGQKVQAQVAGLPLMLQGSRTVALAAEGPAPGRIQHH